MDVVLVLRHAGEPSDEGLFSVAGIERLTGLLAWLRERGSSGELYVVVPDGVAELIAPVTSLASFLAPLVSSVHLVLGARSAGAAVLADCAAAGVRSLVVHVRAAQEDALVLAAFGELRARGGRHLPALRVWLEADAEGYGLARVAAFEAAGLPSAAIGAPPLPLDVDAPALVAPVDALPAELHDDGLLCELYAQALTIDADGEVRACTRYSRGGSIGNLLRDDPAQLVASKGRRFRAITANGICQTCTVRGRFRWGNGLAPALAEIFANGALSAGASDAASARWWT
jgi:hypothetical protein